MRISLASTPSQKVPAPEDDLEARIQEEYKKQTGKAAQYKKSGEWHFSKQYLEFKDQYLGEYYSALYEELEKDAVDAVNAMNGKPKGVKYTELGNCSKCSRWRIISPETRKCQQCDNNLSLVDYMKTMYADLTLTNTQIAEIIMKKTGLTKDKIQLLVREQKETEGCDVKEALEIIADAFSIYLLDDRLYITPQELQASLKNRDKPDMVITEEKQDNLLSLSAIPMLFRLKKLMEDKMDFVEPPDADDEHFLEELEGWCKKNESKLA